MKRKKISATIFLLVLTILLFLTANIQAVQPPDDEPPLNEGFVRVRFDQIRHNDRRPSNKEFGFGISSVSEIYKIYRVRFRVFKEGRCTDVYNRKFNNQNAYLLIRFHFGGDKGRFLFEATAWNHAGKIASKSIIVYSV